MQNLPQKPAGVGFRVAGHFFRGARGHEFAAAVAAFRAQVDEVVRGLDDLQVVFDDDDRVAFVHQAVEHQEQLFDVRQMQPGGGLIQDVEGAAGGPLAQFPGEFEALGLAAG